jgi:two-component system, chemotaxis family, chemotaxis protein CheY
VVPPLHCALGMESLATTAVVFSTSSPPRIEDACSFLVDLPRTCRGELAEVDLGFLQRARLLVGLARTRGATDDASRRVGFWCGVFGGRGRRFVDLSEHAREHYVGLLKGCERRIEAVPAALLGETVRSLASALGWPQGARRREAMPCLDLDHTESHDGIRYDATTGTLFLPAALAPPLGDVLPVLIRGSGSMGVLTTRVLDYVAPGQDGPGMPGGFRARIMEGPPQQIGLLAEWERRTAGWRRSAPRFPYRAPVVATPIAEPAPREHALDAEMELTNISQGGAQVRTRSAPRVGARVRLEFALPSGHRVAVDARVMWRDGAGMGVKFEAGPEQEALIGEGLALLSGRRRRALVIDDDALSREIVGDALAERGYEVLKACDGAAGLRLLTDELLSLDAVVTDLAMPNMDGEAFVRAVRGPGGERDLAIVVATGGDDPFARSRLEATGVDAIVEKRLGGDTIASAVDSAVKARSAAPSFP